MFGEHKGEEWANKIFFAIPICTYKLCRGNKGKGFGDFWEAKRGLTRYDTGPRTGARALDAASFACYSLLGLRRRPHSKNRKAGAPQEGVGRSQDGLRILKSGV